jgi:DNA-directed RNA polymerase specialized sigma24 family protein
MRRNVPSTAQVRSWKITAPAATDHAESPASGDRPSVAAHHGPLTVRHGYTLAALDDLARRVVRNGMNWWPAGDRADQHDTAWHGIVEHLYSTDDAPTRKELLEAGRRTLTDEVKSQMQMHGARRDGTNTGAKFAIYWQAFGYSAPSPESAIVERVALDQVMAALTPRQQEAFTALAACDDYVGAAQMLGIEAQTYRGLIGRARQAFDDLWHEGETACNRWPDRRITRREPVSEDDAAKRAVYAAQKRAERAARASASIQEAMESTS